MASDQPPAAASEVAEVVRPRSPEERDFADEVGFFWEEAGGTRMAGRVLGALLLADPPGMSSSELAAFLGVSAGSVSTATRELIAPGLVTRVRVPGQRQDYFRGALGPDALPQFIRARIGLTRRFAQLMNQGELLAADKEAVVQRQLAEIREFYEFLDTEHAGILERWQNRNNREPAS